MLLELITDSQIAELGRVLIPADCVTTRPIPVRCRTDVERHADTVARIESRASDFGDLPAGSEVARAPLGVGFEATRCNYDGFRVDCLRYAARAAHDDTRDVAPVSR